MKSNFLSIRWHNSGSVNLTILACVWKAMYRKVIERKGLQYLFIQSKVIKNLKLGKSISFWIFITKSGYIVCSGLHRVSLDSVKLTSKEACENHVSAIFRAEVTEITVLRDYGFTLTLKLPEWSKWSIYNFCWTFYRA